MRRRYSLVACTALVLVFRGVAGGQQYSFRHYGTAEGLENLAILSLAQDGAGYIWAGSEGGLYRYDGTRFRLMAAADGLPCVTEVHTLHVAADGALWANLCAQILRYDGQKFHPVAGLAGMLSGAQRMADGADGKVTVATPSGLYEAAQNADGSFSAHPYSPGPEFRAMPIYGIARQGSELWFGCGRNLCVSGGGHVTVFGESQGLPDDNWDAIGFTPDGSVWARSPSRLYSKPPGAGSFMQENREIASSTFWGALTVGVNGRVMVPTDKGLVIGNGAAWDVIDDRRGLPSAMADAVLVDREGSLWVGLIGSGIARWVGLRRMGSVDQGAGAALRRDLEHPARQRRSALGRHVAGSVAHRPAGDATHMDPKRRLGGRRCPLPGRDFRRRPVGGHRPGQRSAHRCRNRKDPSGRPGRRTYLRRSAPHFHGPPGPALGCDGLRCFSQ